MSTESISPIMQSQQIELANIKSVLCCMHLSKTEAMQYIPRYELESLAANKQIRILFDKKRKWLCNAYDVISRAGFKTIEQKKKEEEAKLHKTQA